MWNQELIEYYQNVVKAEDLAYFIDRAKAQAEAALAGIKDQKVFDKSKGDIRNPSFIDVEAPVYPKDVEPQYVHASRRDKYPDEDPDYEVISWIMAIGVPPLMAFLGFVIMAVDSKASSGPMIFLLSIPLLIFFLLIRDWAEFQVSYYVGRAKERKWDKETERLYNIEVQKCEAKNRIAKEIADAETKRNRQEYENSYRLMLSQIDRYNKTAEQTRNDLRIEISRLDSEAKEVAKRLDSLYAIPRVPMHMRGLVASHNMLQYLETGFQMLEGPGGTYEQYYMDLRTDRITDNLTKIEQAVRAGTSEIVRSQASLCATIRGVGDKVGSFASSMSEEMGRLSSMTSNVAGSVQGLSSSVRDFNASTQSQLGKLSAMNQTMAWNEYITAEKLGIDRSLLRHP